MRLTPEQSFNACTINSAYAMGVSDTHGSITVGKKANLIITKPVPSLAFIPYSHQTPIIEKVIINGTEIWLFRWASSSIVPFRSRSGC